MHRGKLDGVKAERADNAAAAAAPAPRSLSLVIPAFNEAARVRATLESAWAYLTGQAYPFELVLVDDGSADETAVIAAGFAGAHSGTQVVAIPHGGKAAALRAGMLAATGELIAFTDADLATPLDYIETFRAIVDEGFDVVIGSREGIGARRIGEPLYRHLMGRVFNLLVRSTVLPGIQDSQCGFKLFRREAAREILACARLYAAPGAVVRGPRVTAFDVELLVVARRIGYRIRAVPVVWTYGTQSKVNPARDTWNNVTDVLRVTWNDWRGRYGKRG